MTAIERFSGCYRFLSSFYPAPVVWEGIHFPTNEHFFNAHKTLDPQKRIRIAGAPTPAEAKKLGGPPTRGGIVDDLRPDWDSRVRYEVMGIGLGLKFADEHLAGLLLATGDAELVEGNDWHDTHWGVCECRRHHGVGDNNLGRMLMELRIQLRHHGGLARVR